MPSSEKAERISITLPPEMLAGIKEKVRVGHYGSTSEVIREALRIFQKHEKEHHARLAAIRDRLDQSANSGAPVPLNEAFDQIEQRHRHRMAVAKNENL